MVAQINGFKLWLLSAVAGAFVPAVFTFSFTKKKKKNDAVNKEKPADLVINLSAGSLVQLFTWEIESSKLLHLFFTLAGGPT